MDFIDQVKQFSKRMLSMKDSLQTEEATKTSLIMPFFSMLGYDVFNPDEFTPEFTADVGIKKGEKVDYAILQNGDPVILIEAKWIGENLDRHDSQLFRYFGTTKAKFAILTNGQFYRFFTDLDEPNKMDEKPFLEIDLANVKEAQVSELKKFCKTNFDVSEIFDVASELKYSNEFRSILSGELQSPSDDFVRFFLGKVYDGRLTQPTIEKFRPVLKKSLNAYISELMSDKIKAALDTEAKNQENTEPDESSEGTGESVEASHESKIVTTEEELEGYFIVKNLLKDVASLRDITFKDNERYMTVLYGGNSRNWICRFYFGAKKTLVLPDENKKEIRYPITDIYDIEQYQTQLIDVLQRYLEP